jgi:hypothetical protein
MESQSNFDETPNLLELIEAIDASATSLADLSICGDDATDNSGLSSSPAKYSLCADEGPPAICADEGPPVESA